MESAGCLIGIAFVLVVTTLVFLIVRWVGRRRRAKRSSALAEAVSGGGLPTAMGTEIPADTPDWEIAPRRKRPDLSISIKRGDSTAYLFDYSQAKKGYSGWNVEAVSSGEGGTTRTYRHTLCCLHDPALSLPTFQVIPSLREKMSDVVGTASDGLRAEGHSGSAGALDMVMGLVGNMVTAQEKLGALNLPDQPDLMAGFRIYGEDEPAVASLATGPMREFLASWPGAILDGQGEWLLVSFNVGLTFGHEKHSPIPQGLLSPEQALHLVEATFELRDTLA